MKSYSIGEFAEKTQLTAHTLRYYEKENLLAPKRASNGWRYYTEIDASWVHFIKRLKETGMSLKQIKQYALLREQGESTFEDRAILLSNHREFVKTQLQLWQDHLQSLEVKIHDYQKAVKASLSRR